MKDFMEKVNEYLLAKVGKVNLNNTRGNRGYQILAALPNRESAISDIVSHTAGILVSSFVKDENGIPTGMARLTTLTCLIGNYVHKAYLDINDSTFHSQAKAGAPIVEAFIQGGLIEVKPEPGFGEHSKNLTYIITPTINWSEASMSATKANLQYTIATKPDDINSFHQPYGYPLIKKWYTTETAKFFEDNFLDAPFIKGIDNLQQTAWVINSELFDIIMSKRTEIIPEVMPKYSKPISKQTLKDAHIAYKADSSDANKDRYNRIAKEWEKTLRPLQNAAKRIEMNTIISKAETLVEWDEFYQLVDCDYRGRIYYKESFLSYQGADLARSLMSYRESKELTEEGKQALAVHTANSFNQKYHIDDIPEWVESDYRSALLADQIDTISVDKFSIDDRITWFNENYEMVLDTAIQQTIHDCEKPMVFLACCLEWRKVDTAVQLGMTPMSNIPVAIDGTCNGYQHAAALSRDEKTGALVALTDSEYPNDLYVRVAHALNGLAPDFFKDRDMSYAEIRKLISKRATMTRAYSAGRQTIGESMYSDCVQAGADEKYDITQIDCDNLAEDILKAIEEVCPGSQKVMKFLQDVAAWSIGDYENQDASGKRVKPAAKKKLHNAVKEAQKANSEESTPETLAALAKAVNELSEVSSVLIDGAGTDDIRWVTRSGFPVIYAPKVDETAACQVTIRGIQGGATNQPGRVKLRGKVYKDIPNRRKIQAGIAPNIIHSQDSTHLLLAAQEFGVNFGAVHDSFSSHASDVSELQRITQEVFVGMYNSTNPLEEIRDSMTMGNCDVEVPTLGSQDITDVLNSQYFFS